MLRDCQLKIVDFYNISIGDNKKMVPNVFHKKKYIIYYESLLLYVRLGLKLKNIYCILEFNQSQWLKQYVAFNREERIEAEKK